MVRKDILERINPMTNTNVAAETISNTIYETKPYGTPEEFNLQAIQEKIIDVEYTEVDDNLERKSANDNAINNNPTPPVTTNALIPVGNSCLSIALPVYSGTDKYKNCHFQLNDYKDQMLGYC